jgi:hypothetical protein
VALAAKQPRAQRHRQVARVERRMRPAAPQPAERARSIFRRVGPLTKALISRILGGPARGMRIASTSNITNRSRPRTTATANCVPATGRACRRSTRSSTRCSCGNGNSIAWTGRSRTVALSPAGPRLPPTAAQEDSVSTICDRAFWRWPLSTKRSRRFVGGRTAVAKEVLLRPHDATQYSSGCLVQSVLLLDGGQARHVRMVWAVWADHGKGVAL